MGKILLINMDSAKRKQIREISKTLGHRALPVNRADYNKTLGALAGFDGMSSSVPEFAGSELSMELMIFAGLSSDELDAFLEAYNESGLTPVKYKAIITPSNVTWTLLKLVEELGTEIREMG